MKITSGQYAKALIDALEESAPDEQGAVVDRFLALLIKNNAVRQTGEILASIEKENKKEKGVEDIGVVTAFPLAEDVRGKIMKKMEKLTGRKVVLNEVLDRSIIGGVVIKFNDNLFDASIKSKIKRMGKSLD